MTENKNASNQKQRGREKERRPSRGLHLGVLHRGEVGVASPARQELPGKPQQRKRDGQAGGWAWEFLASSQVAMATETKRGADEVPGMVP